MLTPSPPNAAGDMFVGGESMSKCIIVVREGLCCTGDFCASSAVIVRPAAVRCAGQSQSDQG